MGKAASVKEPSWELGVQFLDQLCPTYEAVDAEGDFADLILSHKNQWLTCYRLLSCKIKLLNSVVIVLRPWEPGSEVPAMYLSRQGTAAPPAVSISLEWREISPH